MPALNSPTTKLLLALVLLLTTLIPSTAAQTGPQNASIPTCVRACDTLAIGASNCSSTDQLCHCKRQDVILAHIVPCVLNNSTCGANATADLVLFEQLFADVCDKFNISVPTNVTGYVAPSATASGGGGGSVYTGAAASVREASGLVGSLLGLGGLVVAFGVMI